MITKTIISIYLFFTLTSVMQGKEVEILDRNYDYQYVFSPDSSYALKEPIKIYGDRSLKGSPSFILTNTKIEDSKGNKKEPDFLILHKNKKYLKIESYLNGIAEVRDQDREYYFYLGPELFNGKMYSLENFWKELTGKEGALWVEKKLKDDKSFAKIVDEISKCVELKNQGCLISKLNDDDRKSFYEHAHLLWQYENSPCEKIHDWTNSIDSGMIAKTDQEKKFEKEHLSIPWDAILASLALDNLNVIVETNNFKVQRVKIGKIGKVLCNGDARNNVIIEFFQEKNNSQKWDFRFYSFTNRLRPEKKPSGYIRVTPDDFK